MTMIFIYGGLGSILPLAPIFSLFGAIWFAEQRWSGGPENREAGFWALGMTFLVAELWCVAISILHYVGPAQKRVDRTTGRELTDRPRASLCGWR